MWAGCELGERSGAVAQLGERRAGSAKVRGSSPLGSMNDDCGRRRPLAGKTPAAVVAIDGRPGSGSRGAGRDARPTAGRSYAPTIVIVRRTSAVVAVFAVTVTR